MKIEEVSPAFEGNRSSDEITENPYASSGQGNEESLDLESFEQNSSERGICRVCIKAQEDGANRHIILCFRGEMGTQKSPTKKKSFWKLKSSTFLIVTSQLVGSLLAVSKQGSGLKLPTKVETLLITSALSSSGAFLLFLCGLWLKSKTPAGARSLEMVGCAFTVVSFIGMTTIVFF